MAKRQPERTRSAATATTRKQTAAVKPKVSLELTGFNTTNYLIIVGGIVLTIIGYIMMAGGRENPAEFIYEEIYSFRRVTLSPILILLGYIIVIVGIMWRPTEEKTPEIKEESL